MLDLKLYLLKYYRLLIDQLIKQKISNLNNLEGLDASKPSKFFPYFPDGLDIHGRSNTGKIKK